jgi:hypothetical protein
MMLNFWAVVFSPGRAKKRQPIRTKYHAAAGESAVSESPNKEGKNVDR